MVDKIKEEVEVKSKKEDVKKADVKEDSIKVEKKATPATKIITKISFDKLKKEFDIYKKKEETDRKEMEAKLKMQAATIEKLNKNVDVTIKTLDNLGMMVSEFVKKTNEKKSVDYSVDFDTVKNRLEEVEDEVGNLSDKMDVFFDAGEDDDIRSKIEKIERAVFRKLHK